MDYQISKEESDRIQFLRLVFSVMVVFIHSYTEEVNFADTVIGVEGAVWMKIFTFVISAAISGCAVPGFFMISAVLLYRKQFSWRQNVKRKARSLLVPYFILNTFWIAIFFCVSEIPALRIFFASKLYRVSQWEIMDWVEAYLGMNRPPMLYPLWFVRDLFVLNVIAKALKLLIDRFPRICLAFIVTALVFNIQTRMFFLSTNAIAFFSLGYYVVKYNLHFRDLDKINIVHIGFLYTILVAINYLTKDMQVHIAACALSNAVGILFWAAASRYFMGRECKKNLLWAAKYNFSIYLFHEFSLT